MPEVMRSIIFSIDLFIAIWFTSLTIIRGFRGQSIPKWHFITMSLGLTFVITYFMKLW